MGSLVEDTVKIALSSFVGGAITALATALVGMLVKLGRSVPMSPIQKSNGMTGVSWVPIGALIGLLVFGIGGYFLVRPNFLWQCPVFASTEAIIASPADDSDVSQLIIVRGTACNVPRDKELWLLVVAGGVAGYYPQNGPIIVSSEGKWSASAILGGTGTRGFVLYTALADQGGMAAIQRYFAAAPNFTPLDPLPAGIQLIDQVAVVRT